MEKIFQKDKLLRKFLEWLSNEDYFNIPKDEIIEILEDWRTYNSNSITEIKSDITINDIKKSN